ncbi:MAG: VOC family protein [Dehalococcoidia bacterium]
MTADDVKQQLQLPDVGQIGVVVEDLDRAVAFFQSAFGLGPFRIQELEAPNVWDRGEEKHIKARLGFLTMGQVEIELIHILEGDSVHLEFLREHGEGLHHLGFRVKDFQAKLEQAKAMGFDVLQTGPLGRFYAYLDTRQYGGIIVELIEDTGG